MIDIINNKNLIETIAPIEGWLTDHEALLLYTLSRKLSANGDIVEIGSYKGKSTICIALALRETHSKYHVWAIDPHEGKLKSSDQRKESTYFAFLANIKKTGVHTFVKPIKSTSIESSKSWSLPISILFIDGIHNYKHAMQDFTIWSPYFIDGTVVVFHDCFCGEQGVWQAATELLSTRTYITDIGTVSSMMYFTIGNPSDFQKMQLYMKKLILRIAWSIHTSHLPNIVRLFIIHKFLRVFLLHPYTLEVYK